MVPFQHEMRREKRGRQAIEESRLRNEPPSRRKARATVLCHPPSSISLTPTAPTRARASANRKSRLFASAPGHMRNIGVQEQKGASRSHRSALVAGGGETAILRVRYDVQRQGSGEIGKLRRSIRRRIVDRRSAWRYRRRPRVTAASASRARRKNWPEFQLTMTTSSARSMELGIRSRCRHDRPRDQPCRKSSPRRSRDFCRETSGAHQASLARYQSTVTRSPSSIDKLGRQPSSPSTRLELIA